MERVSLYHKHNKDDKNLRKYIRCAQCNDIVIPLECLTGSKESNISDSIHFCYCTLKYILRTSRKVSTTIDTTTTTTTTTEICTCSGCVALKSLFDTKSVVFDQCHCGDPMISYCTECDLRHCARLVEIADQQTCYCARCGCHMKDVLHDINNMDICDDCSKELEKEDEQD